MSNWNLYSVGLQTIRILCTVGAVYDPPRSLNGGAVGGHRPPLQLLAALCILVALGSVPAYGQQCSAEIVYMNPKTTIDPSEVLSLNLFSTVSKPSNCLAAQIHLTATYFDADENFICSGTIEGVADQSTNVQSTNLEVRPLNMEEFVRLKVPKRPLARRLFCMNVEGNIEVPVTDIMAAAFLRLRATILPRNGGVATTELRLTFKP